MSHKPPGLIYGVDETPPLGVNILSGLQHVGLMSIYLVYPVVIAHAAALAIGTVQVVRVGPSASAASSARR